MNTPVSITFEHIKEGNFWVCWQSINDGTTIERTWMHQSASYETSLDIARRVRANYNHLEVFKGVQTIHVIR
jgi:hypothetical protein